MCAIPCCIYVITKLGRTTGTMELSPHYGVPSYGYCGIMCTRQAEKPPALPEYPFHPIIPRLGMRRWGSWQICTQQLQQLQQLQLYGTEYGVVTP